MSKTLEELAEEYANKHECGDQAWGGAYGGFLAGYQAAKKEERLKLAELYSHGSDVQKIASAYFKSKGITGALLPYAENRFIDGYLAAKEHAHAALEEAEVEIDRLHSKLSDAGILTTEHLIDASKMVSSSATLNNWISVKDRLPEIGAARVSEDVLIINKYGEMKVSCFVTWGKEVSVEWGEAGDLLLEDFTHWMPLPAAPKEGE